MNKADLARILEPIVGGQGVASQCVDVLVDAMIREVAAGGTVTLTGFGTFERVERAPRTGRNPRTGEVVRIPGTAGPRFRPSPMFRGFVADPSTLPESGCAGGRSRG
ncbi:HU family DNA-binding protein [Kytococcus sedentarius]|uniref:Bacterial nucleoid DNA-binding protein n=1 Tax=Kytococcus sedentarius (strain ATCC 14392 / DSM 20547 / JCM 11482 / CCUG 33030 / NBRC 15357 / NCTC 11040 / CCM 314 / 541) TaxID=478801 RepID=C7NGK9_KYTSD|nr:HU family DNA-binding protein [Kytococcus sedentarius]ACV06117.1 bacterial nucleoid DNA-binding protein [Kytococcus sedentarius DSM 20547]QQB64477.1 HU family DNA-binding protein [Kytococcus sedentarius]STX12465.1 Histone-like protein [Kytococcus sedentarius]